MDVKLNDYIDEYLLSAAEGDKKAARHLQEIIPKTTHLDKNIFYEIISDLVKEMKAGKDFKTAFREIAKTYILRGEKIKDRLPTLLTRIIVNKRLFFNFLRSRTGLGEEEIRSQLVSSNIDEVITLIGCLQLAPPWSNVVFATFDENDLEDDPFASCDVKDIFDILGLDTGRFDESESLSAVKIRYLNKPDVDKRFPVFPDAGWYDKFFPASKDDKYGRTKNVIPGLVGMPEIVHENLAFEDIVREITILED